MGKTKTKPITRCALCEWFAESAKEGQWMCVRHLHVAEPGDGCTFGREREES